MLKRLIVRWPLKLLALGLAFAIWFTVTGENQVIQAFDVPLDISLGEDVVLSGTPASTAMVTLRGAESLVRSINPLRLAFEVDLRESVPGDRDVALTPELLAGVPEGVEIRVIAPDRVTFQLERRLRRTLPVIPFFLGEPSEGYQLYDFQVLPDSIEVEGPEDAVQELTRLRTEPIRLDEHTEPFAMRVAVLPDSAEVRLLDNRRPEVRVDIDRSPEEVVFEQIPVRVLTEPGLTAETDPAVIRVTVSAPPDLLGSIAPEQVIVVADATGVAADGKPHNVVLRMELDVPPPGKARAAVKSASRREVSVRLFSRRSP